MTQRRIVTRIARDAGARRGRRRLGGQRCVGAQRGRGVAAVAAIASAIFGPGLVPTAVGSPLDPGLTGWAEAPYCSSPRPIADHPGRSSVGCTVGARIFVVPVGVRDLSVTLTGAAGAASATGAPGGAGALLAATLEVTPGETLQMTAGGRGSPAELGGFNGGGNGPHPGDTAKQFGPSASGGGGGSTDVRVRVNGAWVRVLVAGGGGGGAGSSNQPPGEPGETGASPVQSPGGPGGDAAHTGSRGAGEAAGAGGRAAVGKASGAGGAAAGDGAAGSAGGLISPIGGSGGLAGFDRYGQSGTGGDGGGGGGGYGFGGGGGGGAVRSENAPIGNGGGGGGGGSSFADPAFLQRGAPVRQGLVSGGGDGSITISYATPPPISCGQTITSSATLTRDLDCRGSTGLIITGAGTVLDLGGHTITGKPRPGRGYNFGVWVRADATVRDGVLRGFQDGIYVGRGATTVYRMILEGGGTAGSSGVAAIGLDGPDSLRLDSSTIRGMSGTGLSASSTAVEVSDTTITAGAEDGADVGTPGSAVFRHDSITGNAGRAMELEANSLTVANTTMSGNGAGLVIYTPIGLIDPEQPLPSDALTIVGNEFNDNGQAGLQLTGQVGPGALLAYNEADDNGRALGPGAPFDGVDVTLNVDASGNPDPGAAANLTVTGNRADNDAGAAINAPDVTDGGGNLAGPQLTNSCIGVICHVG